MVLFYVGVSSRPHRSVFSVTIRVFLRKPSEDVKKTILKLLALPFRGDLDKWILVSLCTIDLNHKYYFICYLFFLSFFSKIRKMGKKNCLELTCT